MCAQKRAGKKIPTEADLLQSNIDGAGDSIGRITNRGTAQHSLRAKFEKDSREYKELTRRAMLAELYQQDAISYCRWLPAETLDRKHSEPRNLGCADISLC